MTTKTSFEKTYNEMLREPFAGKEAAGHRCSRRCSSVTISGAAVTLLFIPYYTSKVIISPTLVTIIVGYTGI